MGLRSLLETGIDYKSNSGKRKYESGPELDRFSIWTLLFLGIQYRHGLCLFFAYRNPAVGLT